MNVHTEVAGIILGEADLPFKIEVMFGLRTEAIGMAPAFGPLGQTGQISWFATC